MKTPLFVLALSITLAVSPVSAQQPDVRLYAFDDAALPQSIIVKVAYADIEIVGGERDDVSLQVMPIVQTGDEAASRMAALTTFLVPSVDGNTMRIESPQNTQRVSLRLEVPRASAVEIWGSNGGPVVVRRVSGEISIENSNAGVTLDKVSGSAIVHTSNGTIVGEFISVTPGMPMSFATSNGVIDLAFPAALRADITLETDNAGFVSEFVIEPDGRGGLRPLPPDRRRATGRINGGGPLFRLQTDNAPITLRHAPARQ